MHGFCNGDFDVSYFTGAIAVTAWLESVQHKTGGKTWR